MPLERLVLYHLQTPLVRPYELSFGAVHYFDSFVAMATFADGSRRIGESTPLPGYSHETAELMDREYALLAKHGHLKAFLDRNHVNPFVTAPVLTCLDPTLATPVEGEVTLCPILQWNQPAEIAEAVATLASQGNSVIKVKITPDLDATRAIIRATTRAGEQCGVRFRYDANQALDPGGAETVVRWLDHATTELLEQPFPVGAWEEMASLYASCPVPLMLDESILDGADVFLAGGCADYIKLKLAKNGSPSRLLELIRQARENGLKVILGNGVQGMVGCWLEGQVQVLAGLQNPGEMNGYRKVRTNGLADLFDSTPTGFHTRPGLSGAALEQALKECAVGEYHIPTHSTVARCA